MFVLTDETNFMAICCKCCVNYYLFYYDYEKMLQLNVDLNSSYLRILINVEKV